MAARLSLQGPLDVVKHDTLFADKYAKEGEGQGWDIFPSAKQFVFLKGLPGGAHEAHGSGELAAVDKGRQARI